MSEEHTPGPWQIHPNSKGDICVPYGDGFRIIASVQRFDRENIQWPANAILMAAAPETTAERDRLKEDLHISRLAAQEAEGDYIRASDERDRLRVAVDQLKAWITDLQSGLYVNCVYCGHRYGPGETTPVSMADALKAHIEQCPQHPMSALRAEKRDLLSVIAGNDPEMPTPIRPIEWLHTLLNLCDEPHVLSALNRDSDDPDATDMMLRELRELVTNGRTAIAKATS